MGLKIGIVGTGSFAQEFIPLYQAHPLVGEITLCDLDVDKLADNCRRHGIARSCPSLDDLCATDVDAVVLITQHWLHAPQAIQALRAGKHVYSAVPAGATTEEVRDLVRAVEETGRVYVTGETSYYRPGAIYCRRRLAEGAFGRIVYAEGEYYHDWDHGLYEVMRARAGERWREVGGAPPMHYPTHSLGGVVSATGAHAVSVSCQGFVDRHEDGVYRAEANPWGNVFSNETALFRMSDGSACRINEFRRIGHPGVERMSLYGTEGCFQQGDVGAAWVTKDRERTVRLDDELACRDGDRNYTAPVHDLGRLPAEFRGLGNGHGGSHQFLVHDFVMACVEGRARVNTVWDAARYLVPGLIAHESARAGGALLDVPDFGDPPNQD